MNKKRIYTTFSGLAVACTLLTVIATPALAADRDFKNLETNEIVTLQDYSSSDAKLNDFMSKVKAAPSKWAVEFNNKEYYYDKLENDTASNQNLGQNTPLAFKNALGNDANVVKSAASTATVDMTTLVCSNPIDNFSTIVSFKLGNLSTGDDPSNYSVTVKGYAKCNYDATAGLFKGTVDGKVVATDLKQSDFLVARK